MAQPRTSKTSSVTFGLETTFGTPVSTTRDFGLVQNFNWNGNNNLRRIHALSTVQTQFIEAGNFDAAGNIECIMQNSLPMFLVFGDASGETATSTDYKHQFNTARNTFGDGSTAGWRSFTMDSTDNLLGTSNDENLQFEGCIMNSGTFSLTTGNLLMFRGDWLAKDMTSESTAVSAVVDTLKPLNSFNATLSTGTDASEAAITNVQNFDFIVNRNVLKISGFNDRVPTRLEPEKQELEFRFTAAFTDETEHELFLGGTTPASTSTPNIPSMVFNANNGTSLGSGRLELNIDCKDCRYNAVGRSVRIGEWIMQDFTGWAIAPTDIFFVDDISDVSP